MTIALTITCVWLVASGCYWVRRAMRAEQQVAFWHDECRREIEAHAAAEAHTIAIRAAYDKLQTSLKVREQQDTLIAGIAYSARRPN